MPTYRAPVENVRFLLDDVFAFHGRNNLRGFSDASPDLIQAVLTEGAKLAEEVLTPLNAVG
ncbi:acyl-CoA dehydrogenase N-terminal domain-containing protein, partial [Methylobacterium bullatum]